MVLTEESQVDIYPAVTLEPALTGVEENFYTIDYGKIVANSAANYLKDASLNPQTYVNNNVYVPNNNTSCTGTLCTTDLSQYVYQLNSNNNKTGLGITLKVMAGDTLNIFGKSYYHQDNPGSGYNDTIPVLDLLSGFLNSGSGNVTQIHGAVTASQINTTPGIGGIISMFSNQNSQSSSNPLKPRAFINCIIFDEQFKAVDFKVSMVGVNSELKNHYPDLQNITIPKNGFVYIYCSNETPVNVFFDNVQVVHTRGRILEETHYYPFGLTMAGISTKAISSIENKVKFTSQILDDDFGVNTYQMKWRTMDPQIGRFLQIDPLADKYVYNTTYAYAENDVIRSIDLEGLEKLIITHEKVSGNVRKIIAERIVRSGQMQNNNITLKNDNGQEVKITKNVLVLQNDLRLGGNKRDFVQQDDYKGYELIVKSGERSTETVKGNSPGLVGIDIKGEGNKVLTSGDSFTNEGDTHVSTVGYVSGQTSFVKTQSEAFNIIKGQIAELSTVVPNISLDNFNISIGGTKGSLPDLKRVAESVRLTYPGALVTVNPSPMVENKDKINFNVTISAITK